MGASPARAGRSRPTSILIQLRLRRLRPPASAWLVLAVVVVAILATAGFISLRHFASDREEAQLRLMGLQAGADRLSALEWQAMAEGRVSPSLSREVDETRQETLQDLAELTRLAPGDPPLLRVEASFLPYAAAIDEEFRLLADGRLAEARVVDEERVDPGFDRIREAIVEAVAVYDEAADRANLLADLGAALIIAAEVLATALLLWRFERSRRAGELLAAERAALSRSERRFRALVQSAAELVAVLDRDGTVRYQSPASKSLLGLAAEATLGRSFLDYVHPDDVPTAWHLLDETAARPGARASAELRLAHTEGSWRHVEAHCRNLLDEPDVAGLVINARDVSERRALEEQLAHRAFHDVLTELPNRALLLKRLAKALARAARTDRTTAIAFVDLDDFKVINDSLGHRAGDQLLVAVAERLRASIRPGDTAARLGGDEFIVLLEDLAEPADAAAMAERFLAQLQAPFLLEAREVMLGASVGIAVSDGEPCLPEDLLRRADMAMYAAKAQGKAQYVFFDPDMDARPLERLELEVDLRRALERGELRLHYQPVVELESGRLAGLEALLRWQHPERGLVPPEQFIPLAEERGLIVPLGRWVLREACRRARAWRERYPGARSLVMSVNLSGRQFQHPRLVEDVATALRETGLEPGRLRLEITESVAMEAGPATIQVLQALRSLGVQLAIDDFGTGYSSLAYLKRLPVDALKIDRAFVDGLGHDEQDTAIVRSVLSLARTLGLRVTAEGIETAEQCAELQALACDEGQGYYFARPAPDQVIEALLATGGFGFEDLSRAA